MNPNQAFSEWGKAAMHNAFWLASSLRHNLVGSLHLLWSVARDERSTASRVLGGAGLDHPLIQDWIERYGQSASAGPMPMMSLSPEGQKVVELAQAQARKLGHAQVEPEHLLLAMMELPDCGAVRLLDSTGVDRSRIHFELFSPNDWLLDA